MRGSRLLAASGVLLLGCGGGDGGAPVTGPSSDPSCSAVVAPVPNEGWSHVPEGSTVNYRANPPASVDGSQITGVSQRERSTARSTRSRASTR